MTLKIIAPDRVFYDGEADFVEFTTANGDMGIYPGHVAQTEVIYPGVLTIHVGGEVKEAALHSGFVEILQDSITIVAEAVEWPDEIDINRAEQARIRAERKIKDAASDETKAELALKRSVLRISMADKKK